MWGFSFIVDLHFINDSVNIIGSNPMRESEKEIYNRNLRLYSDIVREKNLNREDILECQRLFEYFEDYEKCEHLLQILKDLDETKDNL